MSITCYKLMSGEELVGNDEGPNTISDPAIVMMMPSQDGSGRFSVGLIPFLPYAEDKTFTLNPNAIITKFAPSVEMINNYNRLFGSGIQIAKTLG